MLDNPGSPHSLCFSQQSQGFREYSNTCLSLQGLALSGGRLLRPHSKSQCLGFVTNLLAAVPNSEEQLRLAGGQLIAHLLQ